MTSRAFEASTEALPHRRALLSASGAGLAALLSGAFGSVAKPKPGKLARKKAKAKCKSQVGQCTLATTLICNDGNDPQACKESFLPCCDHLANCNAGAFIQCIFT